MANRLLRHKAYIERQIWENFNAMLIGESLYNLIQLLLEVDL
jgi:hypothetical protein